MMLWTRARHVSRIGLVLLILASVLAATPTPAHAVLATNDHFVRPTVVGSLPFQATQNNQWATTEPGEPDACHMTKTLWYRFTPTTDTIVTVDTADSTLDTVLGVYTGSDLNTLRQVGCNDDFNGLRSRVSWLAKKGVPYQIRVGGYPGGWSYGDLKVSVTGQEPTVIPNDDLSSATMIEGLPYSATQTTAGATMESNEPAPCSTGNTVWYRLRIRQDTPLRIATEGSDFDTVVAVYAGSQMSDLSQIDCNDDNGGGALSWTAEAKVDYFIQVGGYEGAWGLITLNVTEEVEEPRSPPGMSKSPRNDDFEDAIAIRNFPSQLSQSTVGATRQDGEPWGSCGAGSASVWYSFKPRKTGIVSLDTAGSNFDTSLAVYTSDQLSTLREVACNDADHTTGSRIAKLSWTAEAGVQYYIQAGGWFTGDLKMSISQTQ